MHHPSGDLSSSGGGGGVGGGSDYVYTPASDLPEIEVVIVAGERDFTIKVSDQGGGIPHRDMARIWTYLHTTAPPDVQRALLTEGASSMGLTGTLAREHMHARERMHRTHACTARMHGTYARIRGGMQAGRQTDDASERACKRGSEGRMHRYGGPREIGMKVE